MDIKATILFVDDEENILSALKRLMRKAPFHTLFANSGAEALDILEEQAVDVVVSDMKMPEMSGDQLLSEVARLYPETVRIVLSGFSEENLVMSAINDGRIWGFIHKPWNDAELRQSLDQAVFTQQVIAERALLRHTLNKYKAAQKEHFMDFIGSSVPMQMVYTCIEKAAPSSASVFVTGESGTGKELVARAIHQLSPRKEQPFIALNCAAIPSELMESEIFGHVKGAFSGAVANREGAATLANGGTLFLDELAEMDMSLQSKLLRFIQTGTFQRVGSNKVEKVDIRFVCATNREPMKAIQEKTLREDLYYRLNVVSISLPSLRERDSDSVMLAQSFLQRFVDREGKELVGFAMDAEKLINAYEWPGNVRQLENCIHSAVIMSNGPLITEQDIAGVLGIDSEAVLRKSKEARRSARAEVSEAPVSGYLSASAVTTADSAEGDDESFGETTILPLSEVEEIAIKRAIDVCDGNVVKAASLLQVSPSTLYRKIQTWQ